MHQRQVSALNRRPENATYVRHVTQEKNLTCHAEIHTHTHQRRPTGARRPENTTTRPLKHPVCNTSCDPDAVDR